MINRLFSNQGVLLKLLCLAAITTGCDSQRFVNKQYPFEPYTCEENCVPVRFMVHVANDEVFAGDIYLSGTFNNWIHGEKKLKLKSAPAFLEKEISMFGKPVSLKEKEAYKPYWIDLELPVGITVDYRYAFSGLGTGGYPEEIEFRTLRVDRDLVQIDSVHQWGKTSVMTQRPERIDWNQKEYLRIELDDYSLPEGTQDPLNAVLGEAETIWKEKGMRHFPGYEHVLMRTYSNLFFSNQDKGNIPRDLATECRFFSDYLFPAYEREFEYAIEHLEPGSDHYQFIFQGASLFPAVYCDSLSDIEWSRIEALYSDVIPEYMEKYRLHDDEKWHEAVSRFREYYLDTYKRDFAFRRALDASELDEAQRLVDETILDTLGRYVKIDQEKRRLDYMPQALALKYVQKGRADEALALLDRVAMHTSILSLSTETLETWYNNVAGITGVERFEELVVSRRRKPLEGSGDPIPLTNSYFNVTSGIEFDLAELQGKTVVIDFWALWCPPCIGEIPQLIEFNNRLAGQEDVVFISVSLDARSGLDTTTEQVRNLIEEKEINFPVLFDRPENGIADQFNINYIPAKYVIDDTGRLIGEVQSVDDILEVLNL